MEYLFQCNSLDIKNEAVRKIADSSNKKPFHYTEGVVLVLPHHNYDTKNIQRLNSA